MRNIIIILSVIYLSACAAAGVTYTSDPYKKISNAYQMVQMNRYIPAERFAKEALKEFIKTNDKFGQGEAYTALGGLYKQMFKNQTKAIKNFKNAIKAYQEANNYTMVGKAKFGLANAYHAGNQLDKHCDMYNQSIADYKKGKKLNPKSDFRINPRFTSFEEMVNAFKNKYCS